VWRYKFLIFLGVLVALSSGLGTGTSSGTNLRFDAGSQDMGFGSQPEAGVPFWLALFLVGVGLVIALVLWVVSTLARGGLIAGAAAADSGQSTSFSKAWRAGWRRGWTLLGIGLLPAIPGLFLLFLGGLGFLGYVTNTSSSLGVPALTTILVALACLAVPMALVLELVRVFANRACMLEGLGVLDSYRRGIEVLVDNLGSALVLFLVQVAAIILIFLLLFVPGLILALCCLFWPIMLLGQGAVTAYFSTMWTLAWQEWTGEPRVADEPVAA
jgi:hypothetical protein